MSLSPQQQLALKRQAHHLKPVVTIAAKGLTDGVNHELDRALYDHELIKVKIVGSDRDARKALAQTISKQHGAHIIHTIGHMVIFYKESDKKSGKETL